MKKVCLIAFYILTSCFSTPVLAGSIVGESEDVFSTPPEHLADYTEFGSDSGDQGENMLRNLVSALGNFIPKFLTPIMIIWIIYAGFELFLSRDSADAFTDKKNQVLYIGMGFGLIFLVPNLVDFIFFGKEGDIFSADKVETYAQNAVTEMHGIFKFMSSLTVAIGTLFLVMSAFKLILAGDNADEMGNVKKRVIFTTAGMIVMITIEKLVGFLSRDQKISVPDHSGVIEIMVKTANYVLGFLGLISLVALVWAGVRLIANFGDDSVSEEAKKTIQGAVMGLVLAFSAFVIIQYMIAPQAA